MGRMSVLSQRRQLGSFTPAALWRRRRTRRYLLQAAVLLAAGLVLAYLIAQALDLELNFDFLSGPGGFSIPTNGSPATKRRIRVWWPTSPALSKRSAWLLSESCLLPSSVCWRASRDYRATGWSPVSRPGTSKPSAIPVARADRVLVVGEVEGAEQVAFSAISGSSKNTTSSRCGRTRRFSRF